MPVVLNFDQREDRSFDPVPIGVYKLIVTDVEILGPGKSGYKYANFELAIAEGEFEGTKIWKIMSFSPKAFFNVEEMLTALGENPEDLKGEYQFDETAWVGSSCQAVLAIDHYVKNNGEPGVKNIIEQGTMVPLVGWSGESGNTRRKLS